eukprot:c6562_g1_i1 orf=71-424(+)
MGMEKETANAARTSHARASRAAADDDSQESAAKYRRYEKEYLRRINHKYFSGFTLSGEPVFESNITIDGFLFKESKNAPLKKFVEGPNVSEDQGRSGVAIADTAPAPSRKNSSKKPS